METDIRYYRRRACEEMSAASRAVTAEARARRLQLVNIYLDHLKELNAPAPFNEEQLAAMAKPPSRAAFGWSAPAVQTETA